MLFQKYASPFSLLDVLISNCNFYEWLTEFVDSENERQINEIWLHKVWDMSFEDFRNSVLNNGETSDKEVIEIINSSRKTLNNFIPNRG